MKCSLGISDCLEEISSLSHSVVFLYFFALVIEEGFLISPCYSFELCIQMPRASSLSPRGSCCCALPHSQGQVLLRAAPTPTLTLELSFSPTAFILCGVSLWLRPQKLKQFLEESGPSLILG